MSRTPSNQQTSNNKSQNTLPYSINESIQRSFANNNPYLNLNNVPSAHQFNPNMRDMRPPSSSQELKTTSNFNNPHSIEQAQTNLFNNMSRKPSLLSGYHNPFSSPERNELLFPGIPPGMSQNRFFPSSNTSSQSSDLHFNNASSAAAAAAMSAYFNGLNTTGKYTNNNINNNNNNNNSNSSSRHMLAYEDKSNSKNNSNSNQTGLRSISSQPNMNLHQPNNLAAINQPSQLTPAIISAAASALSSMGIGPTHPHYAQLIQQQFQLHLQQNQLKNFVNQSSEKKDSMTPKPSIPMSNPSPHAQILKPNIQQQISSQSSSSQNASTTTSSSSTSSSYVPQVEAISPTPEDHKENSNLQALKEKICSEIEKVEKDYASTQYQLEMLKKKQIELEKLQNKPILDENADKTNRPKELTLAEKIYKENKKKAEESHREILKPINSNKENVEVENNLDELIPLYHEYSDTKIFKETRISFEKVMKNKLMKYFKRQILLKNQREKILIDKYDSLHTNWSKKVDKLENSSRKKQKDLKSRDFYEKFFPEIRKQREERERLLQKQAQPQSTIQNSTTNNQTTGTDSQTTPEINPLEEERKRVFQLAVVPPSCFDGKQKKYKFIDNNGFVSDPVSLFKAVKNEVYWDEKEKAIFLEKLLTFGKNFEIIASYLDKKRVQDCIEYYYLTKKKVNYKLLIRKHQRKRKKDSKLNPNSSNNNNSGNGNSGSGNSNNNPTTFGSNNQNNNNQNANQTNSTNSNNSNNSGSYTSGTNQLSSLNTHESIPNINEQIYQSLCENNQNNLSNENVNLSHINNVMFNGILDGLSTTSNHTENIKRAAENSSDDKSSHNRKEAPNENSSSKEGSSTNLNKNTNQKAQRNNNQERKNEEGNDDGDGNEEKRDKASTSKAKTKKKGDCCACKKSNAKKKGKNKIRIRQLSNKVQFLDKNQKELLKSEFNINIKSNCDEPKFRLCLSCFKKISNKLNQFVNRTNAPNTENESKHVEATSETGKLETACSDSKTSDEKIEHESNENLKSGDSSENSEKLSDDDYYDYDDEDSNTNEALKNEDIQAKAEDNSDSGDLVDRKASKRKLDNDKSNDDANNDSNNNLLFSKDLNILSQISNLINSETNSQALNDESSKNGSTSSNERSILKAQPKQISDIINDAIKSALHNNQDPLELITKSKLPTNIDLLSSLTKNEISLSNFLTNFQQLVQTTRESEKQSKETSNDTNNLKYLIETKSLHERLTSNQQKQPQSSLSVLNELISKHKNEVKASEETIQPSVSNESKEKHEQEKSNKNKNYTLGKWVDAIISKMNVPSDIELDINDPMIRSNFPAPKLNQSVVNEKDDSNDSVQSDSNQQKVKIDSNKATYSQNDDKTVEKEYENETLKKKFRFSSDNSLNIQAVNEAKQRSQTEIPVSNIIKNEMKPIEENNELFREKKAKMLQQNNLMEEKSSYSKSPAVSVGDHAASSGSGDVWNNMFGGIIMNSLLQDLPPALSLPPSNQEQGSGKSNRNRSNQSPNQSQNPTNHKQIYNEKELPSQFQTGPNTQNVPHLPARQTKDLLFQARSYAPQPNVPSTSNLPKHNKSSNLQSQQPIIDPFAEQKAYNSLIESLSGLNPQTILELINSNQLPNFIKSLGFNNENQFPSKTISPGHSNQLSSQIHAQIKEIDKQQAFSMPKHNSNPSIYSSHMNNPLLSPSSASPQIIPTRTGSQSSPFNSSSIVHNAPHHTNISNSISNDKHSLTQQSNNGSNINNNTALSSFMSSALFQNNPNMPLDPFLIQQLINSGNFNFPNHYPSNEHQLNKQSMPILSSQYGNSANSSPYDLGQRFQQSPQPNNNFNLKLSHSMNQTVNSQNNDNNLKQGHMLHRQSQNHSKQHELTNQQDLIQQFYQSQLLNHQQQQINYKKRMLASNETASSTTQVPNPIQSKPEKSAHSLTKKI